MQELFRYIVRRKGVATEVFEAPHQLVAAGMAAERLNRLDGFTLLLVGAGGVIRDSWRFDARGRTMQTLTLQQAAGISGYSETWLYELIRARKLPAFQPGGKRGHYRIREDRLRNYMEAQA